MGCVEGCSTGQALCWREGGIGTGGCHNVLDPSCSLCPHTPKAHAYVCAAAAAAAAATAAPQAASPLSTPYLEYDKAHADVLLLLLLMLTYVAAAAAVVAAAHRLLHP